MWLILADDLTGAADCAIAFARRGVASVVGWGKATDGGHPVFAYNADSRGLSAEATLDRHRGILARFPGRALFAKMDSTLRGHPAAAIAAAMEGRALGVLAPAFPAAGRTTQGGRVFVNGAPLEESETWRRDHTYASADLLAMLATAGLPAHPVPLTTVRGDGLHATLRAVPPGSVAVCDAIEQADLARVARAAPPGACFIGTAGLAHALAETLSGGHDPVLVPPSRRGALVVVGSLATASRDGARVLSRLDGVRHLLADPEAPPSDLGARIGAALEAGHDVLLEIAAGDHLDLSIGPRVAAALAQALRPAAPFASGLAATGGETAAALMEAFGIRGIRLVEEPEPGVSLGVSMGEVQVPLATKAGAFGDDGTLVRIVRRLRQIRQRGTFE